MQISIDNQNLISISDEQKAIMRFCYPTDKIDDLIKDRVSWIVNELCTQTFNLMKKEWEPKLIARGVESLPADKIAFSQLVFSQPDYKDRAQREAELLNEKAAQAARITAAIAQHQAQIQIQQPSLAIAGNKALNNE